MLCGLLIGIGSQNQPVQCLEAPFLFHELGCQKVQQFWMRGPVAVDAKVAGCPNQPFAEMMLPNPIHDDTGCQWVFCAGDPFSQGLASSGTAANIGYLRRFTGSRDALRKAWLNLVSLGGEFATRQNVGVGQCRHVRRGDIGDARKPPVDNAVLLLPTAEHGHALSHTGCVLPQ